MIWIPTLKDKSQAFGGHGVRPDSLASFEVTVAGALEAHIPTLIEVQEGAGWLVG